MTTTTFSCAPDNTSDATFRAWVSALIGALDVVATRTADTGQVNTATVARPTTVNTVAGYALWTMAGAPSVVIKLEFGTAGYATVASSLPQVWITVGKGSDGAGNVQQVLIARRALAVGTNSAAANGTSTVANGIASGGNEAGVAGWLALIPWIGYSASAGNAYPLPYFAIERTSTALIVLLPNLELSSTTNQLATTSVSGSADLPVLYVINYATGTVNLGCVPVVYPGTINGSALAGSTSLAAGAVGPVAPWVVIPPGLTPMQCVDALSYPGGDTPAGTFSVTLNGVTRTYMPVPLSNNHNAFGFAWAPLIAGGNQLMSRYVGLAIRWE